MDVAAGETDVPLPRKSVRFFRFWIFFFLLGFARASFATVGDQPIHSSGDKQVWDRKANIVELFGHAAVTQQGETLTADYIRLNMKSRMLDAKGNCVYNASDSTIYGEEMHFNLDTRTGTIVGGRVSNDQFTLRGETIYKLGNGRFLTHWGDYSTCRDCAPTWSLLGEDVDMQVDGYAYISNLTTQIKDAPTFWLPYLVVPMKTRRQTGFLFPPFTFSGINGATFVFPFYWAINRSSDATVAVGQYTRRGWRVQGEGRYVLSPRSSGKVNAYYTQDRTFPVKENRWAFEVTQSHELSYDIREKLRWTEVGDNVYPFVFSSDVRGGGEAFLPSTLSFSRSTSDISLFGSIQRNRNLLNSNPNPDLRLTEFDPHTVQVYPTLSASTVDRFLIGSDLLGGISVGVSNFTRTAGTFDYNFTSVPFGTAPPPGLAPIPGVDPIRKGTRVFFTPSVYTTLRPFDAISVIPSLQYRGYFYSFGSNISNLNRGYLLFQTDLSTQIEKLYDFPDDPTIPRTKHLIRPLLTYSYIPGFGLVQNPNHPFLKQIENAQNNNIYGYNFDNNDIVPITFSQNNANYFVPLGNSLAYGFSTQWIRKRMTAIPGLPASYQTPLEFSAGQAINFLEINKSRPEGQPPRVFTRLFSRLNLNFDRISSATNYYYYPDIAATTPRHTISTSLSYIMERAMHQRVLTYDRSVTLGYAFNKVNAATSNLTGTFNFSINDYFMPYASISYGFIPIGTLYGASAGMQIQSPSQCWKFTLAENYTSGLGTSFAFDLSLNLTGSGFGGITELATQAQSQSQK
jgi:lipopolysaccharide assembly outer membrane protein LptD (OstA)